MLFLFISSSIINLKNSPLIKNRYGYFLENKNDLNKVINSLPENARISTQNAIIPHLSHLDDIYIFPNLGNSEYILLNLKIDSYWPLQNKKEFNFYLEKIKNKQKIENLDMPFIK